MQCAGSGQIKSKGNAHDTHGNPDSRRTDIFIIRQKATAPKPGKAVKNVSSKTEKTIVAIDYKKIKVGDTFKLENIQFINGETTITPASYPEVDKLYNIMLDHPTLKIRLEGHVCCCVYPDGYFPDTPNFMLSVARARKIYGMLVKKGIAPQRMEYKGFGRTHPILDNEETIENGQVNRRVEVRILEK
jgi:outer membrane protein OmpA-like peptidoglycan-associated protein